MKLKHNFFKPSDIEFLMRAVVFSLMVMALLHAFTPYISDSKAAVSRAEVEDLARQTRLMTPEEVITYLQQSTRPTMVVVYASWCRYCKELMPHIQELWSEGKIPGDQMLLISLDEHLDKLSTYLLENRFKEMLGVPIVINSPDKSDLAKALKPLGSSFTGGIPYIGFFGANAKVLEEIHGAVGKSELEAALVHLK